MTSSVQSDERRAETTRPMAVAWHDLCLQFATAADATRYLRALASLFSGVSKKTTATSRSGVVRGDFTVHEMFDRIERSVIESVRFAVSTGAQSLDLEITQRGPEQSEVAIRAPFTMAASGSRLWLQCDADAVTPIPAVVLPIRIAALTLDAAHTLVGLAVRSGGLRGADLTGEQPISWSPANLDRGAMPLHGAFRDAVWSVAPDSSTEVTGPPIAWVNGLPRVPPPHPPDAAWWERLYALTRAARQALPELKAHLATQLDIPFPWVIEGSALAPSGQFAVPPEASAVARLVAESERVVVAVDTGQPGTVIADMLLHLCAHLALGHVRPGDPWGHWDTPASLSPTPHRQWDREVRGWIDARLARPTRRVSSLEECDPREKGWLVLLDHIGRMVGQARTLHTETERYQAAAYQRQAAQRLVAQLEEYGGAMLCDGVGLGKTYVATTIVVHYQNSWREQLARVGRSAADDPLRVTILAPNSVVSTWQREALPPLAAHGVPLATIRVVSHTKLSRILPSSDILARGRAAMSDMEHLLLSDLVVVDEAHNFRSVGARRTTVLRDLLRLQPRKDLRRKVLLLTATPVNNSLEDLRQQAALMFCKPLFFNDNLTPEKYRARVFKDVEERLAKALKGKGADVAALLIHGIADARFAYAPDFRDDVQFGVQVPRVGDYLKEQEKRLASQQAAVRADIQRGQPPVEGRRRVAGELLDRVVVQRSRALCKQIEREQGSTAQLLFRPDAPPPEKLVYEDVYDDTRDVLARFLPLFDGSNRCATKNVPSLTLKVYMWADVRDGVRDAGEVSSVVGLQRVLVLKRLESSPVAFLITLLRLLALHAHRLEQLLVLCRETGDKKRERTLGEELAAIFEQVPAIERERLDLLLTGGKSTKRGRDLLSRWSKAHVSAKAAADTDDPPPPQLELFAGDDDESDRRQEQLERLWALREHLTCDLGTLLRTAPGLADIVFGRFAETDWPQRFINGGEEVAWPISAVWATRIVTDGKLRRLVARLLRARADGQKVIVFSQFTDTLAYVHSVLRATSILERNEWKTVLRQLSADAGKPVSKEDVLALVGRAAVVSGETEDRDTVMHAFAPFYRLGPLRPRHTPGTSLAEQEPLDTLWRNGWAQALQSPIDVLLATDVLAEGVNLQDAALLVNFDVHWNPVRMIQRAGRIDRRLNPAIEEAASFPDIESLARDLGVEPPRYWWHSHRGAAPLTVNLLLSDELEAELQLRERIANKTLAIDFTLGLEQGTGAEADWMAEYRYQGISALNAWQTDRAIEQIAGYQQRLTRLMSERGIEPSWVTGWNGWLREVGGREDDCVLAWAQLGRKSGDTAQYTRQLQPRTVDGIPHWLWTTAKPMESLINFWLALDGKTFPATVRNDLGFSEDASRPIAAEDLLAASHRLVDGDTVLEDLGDVRRPLLQGASAISAGFLGAEPDRRALAISGFRLLQLRLADMNALARPSEEAC